MIAALLSFFLGIFGAANFYMGNNLFGFIKLPFALFGLFFLISLLMPLAWVFLSAVCIWEIAEFIMILMALTRIDVTATAFHWCVAEGAFGHPEMDV